MTGETEDLPPLAGGDRDDLPLAGGDREDLPLGGGDRDVDDLLLLFTSLETASMRASFSGSDSSAI